MFSLCTIFTTLWLLPISSFTMSLCVFVAMTGKILCEIHRSRKYVRRLGFFEMKDNGENWFGVFWFTVVFCLWMNALCAELQSQSKAKTAKCRAGFDHIFNDRAMIIWSRSKLLVLITNIYCNAGRDKQIRQNLFWSALVRMRERRNDEKDRS